jgi:peptide-methionine (S)-S-oxide reductase
MGESGRESRALLAGGCFWCLEAVFERLPGVLGVESGYSGGTRDNPSYEEVSSGRTGHAEAVRIRFDPEKLSYAEVLETFWKVHDPTTEDRQGADIGSQYRSAIFYLDEEQRRIAEDSKAKAQAGFEDPIVTEILPASAFWPAEAWHGGYFRAHPLEPYCRIVIAPKIAKAGL